MNRRRHSLCAAMATLLVLLTGWPAHGQHLRILYPDIEQGSAVLVVSPTGNAMLVDAGSGLSPADDDIALYVQRLITDGVITSLDFVVASHYDEDHIGRLEDVLSYGGVSPSVITYDRGGFGGTPSTFAFADYLDAALDNNRTTITPFTDLDLGGGVMVECYAVNGALRDGSTVDLSASGQFENSTSVALVVRYGSFDAWIGGDLTGSIDAGVADVEGPTAALVGDLDLYTVNHHGSRTSSSSQFLSTIKAEVAINQSSVTNGFGHANSEVVTRFINTPDTNGNVPRFFLLNRGDPDDPRSDDSLAAGIADPDDLVEVLGLPGTVSVLSDGNSYQVFGGNIAPVTLPADTGSGFLGDYPPAITLVTRNPLVPTAAQSVSVTAQVFDEATPNVAIRWWRDDVLQAPIPMSVTSGNSYQAQIPALPDGTKVELQIEASDAGGGIGLSQRGGYFAGTTSVATLRDTDANGLLNPARFDLRVEGDITAEPGVFHPFVSQLYVQDATGGVLVFDGELLPLARGDRASFVGRLELFSSQAELNISQPFGNYGFANLGPSVEPPPLLVSASQVDESLEGRLIRIDGATVFAGSIPEAGNGNLTITDDGGVSLLTLRVDGDTDIPGADTPTQAFDVIGIASQFDPGFPFTSGYQILPRERSDFLSNEVNAPVLLINEIHADPDSSAGDANGDGAVSSSRDEFIELANTTFSPLDISGWQIADAVATRHVFPAGTVVPPREVAVVFGGGTPSGSFGNAAANGLVQTASSGRLGLNNSGDTITLSDGQGATIQIASYGSEGGQNQSLTRQPDLTNTPYVQHTQVAPGLRYSPGVGANGQAFSVGPGAVLITEVMYDPAGSDGGAEWIELYNTTNAPIDLGSLSLGSGGTSYTSTVVQLTGTIAAGSTFVVGGPTASAANGNPSFDLVVDWSPDLQNSGSTADGVALFNVRAAQVSALTVPIDAVVYGGANVNGLIDETGIANAPEVADVSSGESVERVDLAGAWQVQAVPTPNAWTAGGGPPPPPAGNAIVIAEVFYDAVGADNGFEWVELYNAGSQAVDLAGFSLGSGGSSYTSTRVQLSGTIAAGATFVVGGPSTVSGNGNPVFDQAINWSPDLQNSGSTADGVALFDVPSAQITTSTVPVDAVIYGGSNTSGLIDETGSANPPDVGDAPAGSSIERSDLAGTWQVQGTPTPGATPLP